MRTLISDQASRVGRATNGCQRTTQGVLSREVAAGAEQFCDMPDLLGAHCRPCKAKHERAIRFGPMGGLGGAGRLSGAGGRTDGAPRLGTQRFEVGAGLPCGRSQQGMLVQRTGLRGRFRADVHHDARARAVAVGRPPGRRRVTRSGPSPHGTPGSKNNSRHPTADQPPRHAARPPPPTHPRFA